MADLGITDGQFNGGCVNDMSVMSCFHEQTKNGVEWVEVGGEMVLDVAPLGGRCVLFLSGAVDHSVMPSNFERTINDVARSIATALSTAIANANSSADVEASSFAFAQAIARAYARIISSHYGRVYTTAGGTACAFTRSTGEATASAISQAVVKAFSESTNQYASAAAGCFANAVSSASYTATQNAFTGVCTNYGYDFIYRRFVTTGYVQTIATAFSSVFTAIRDNNAQAAASCGASGTSQSGQTTIVTGSG
eukprot:g5212.t1